jgi:hypothetical protein
VRMEQSMAMQYGSRKASPDVLKPRHIYRNESTITGFRMSEPSDVMSRRLSGFRSNVTECGSLLMIFFVRTKL